MCQDVKFPQFGRHFVPLPNAAGQHISNVARMKAPRHLPRLLRATCLEITIGFPWSAARSPIRWTFGSLPYRTQTIPWHLCWDIGSDSFLAGAFYCVSGLFCTNRLIARTGSDCCQVLP